MENEMTAPYLERTKDAHVFAGSDMNIWGGAVLAVSLRSYAKQVAQHGKVVLIMGGAKPAAALKMATSYTKKKYKQGEYAKAAEEVTAVIEEFKQKPRTF